MEIKRIDDYILHACLNEGGTAEVFFATNPQEKAVALRRLRSTYRFNLTKRVRFKRGMQTQMQMHGPHVAHVLEIHTNKLIPYAVMEFIEGMNLRQVLVWRKRFLPDWTNAFVIFEKIAKGVGEIHRRGAMHLDIKPENTMINHAGEVKILDFDLARPVPKQPVVLPSIVGTPSYLAPELLLSKPADERADIFALGVFGYELFTGQKPTAGQTREEVFRDYTAFNTAFPSLTGLNPALPKALNEILLRCVEKKMEWRYPAVALILRDLYKVKLPVSVPQPSPVSPTLFAL